MTKRKFQLTKLTYIAVFTALSTIFNVSTICLNRYFALSFCAVPCMLAGMFLGPISGFAVGFLGDLLGCLIKPNGPFLISVSIASGLLGFIPGLVFKFKKDDNDFWAIVLSSVLTLLVCTVAINTTTFWFVFAHAKNNWWNYLVIRLPWQTLMTFINMILVIGLNIPLKNHVFNNFKLAETKA